VATVEHRSNREINFASIVEINFEGDIMDETTIKYVNRSKYRVRTLKAIGDGVKMPKEIAEDSGILQNHISNVLRELKDKDLVECLNPNARKGRLYRLSDDGKDMLDKIK